MNLLHLEDKAKASAHACLPCHTNPGGGKQLGASFPTGDRDLFNIRDIIHPAAEKTGEVDRAPGEGRLGRKIWAIALSRSGDR